MNSTAFTLPSFAKINWRLKILGKRHDGYHELRTILQTISLHDDLHFEKAGAITLECDDKDIPTDDRNLIVGAAHALKEHYGVTTGAGIRLQKRIPVKAGLGGGSSNAAVTLLALAYLWEIDIVPSALAKVAATFGADVPFFLSGGTALGEGTGATISPLPDVDIRHLIVLTPNASVSTAEAYRAVNSDALTTLEVDPILSSSPSATHSAGVELAPVFNNLENDFESAIFDREPEIGRAKEALLNSGAGEALLAGSGSSVFGVFPDQRAQRIAIDKIELELGWQVFPCVTLSRNEYVQALSVNEKISLPRFFQF